MTRLTTPENAAIVRRIFPSLPSYEESFTRSEPLTRIRDIAHRNDIPKELKHEIKVTLQNKLHRCAGPEDLVTSERLLSRVTQSQGDYSAEFVNELRTFHDELKRFFNAQDLRDRLRQLADQESDTAFKRALTRFLEAKDREALGLDEAEGLLQQTTDLRRECLDKLAGAEEINRLAYRITEIQLEEDVFTQTSSLLNHIETLEEEGWKHGIGLLDALMENLRLDGMALEEFAAIRAELRAVPAERPPEAAHPRLRMRATLERCQRLYETVADRLLERFGQALSDLGAAFQIAEDVIRQRSDDEVRRSLVFQFSKVTTWLQKRLISDAEPQSWETITTGKARGKLEHWTVIESSTDRETVPLILLLDQAEGDEEIPNRVVGIILRHEIPHLSHLSVRARQSGTPLANCRDPALFEKLASTCGQLVLLTVLPEEVTIEPLTEEPKPSATIDKAAKATEISIPSPTVSLQLDKPVLPVQEISQETSGRKADSLRRLETLAKGPQASFHTLPTLVIPFAGLVSSIEADEATSAEYRRLISQLNGDEIPKAQLAKQLNDLVMRLPVPESWVKAIEQTLGANARFAVRSSSSLEDAPGRVAAGVYESMINIPANRLADAIRQVWASLWSERAILSREQNGLPHTAAHMAVIVQSLLDADYSFILHTVNPLTRRQPEVYLEVVVGLGEALAGGGQRGSPYRMIGNKETGEVDVKRLASFSQAARPHRDHGLSYETLDYSQIPLTSNPSAATNLGRRLTKIGTEIEQAFHGPQDIEGMVSQDEIYIVQSRLQIIL